MAKTTEEKLAGLKKTGRIAFSVADALGTLGKALVQAGGVLLLAGFVGAIVSEVQQHRSEKLKKEINNRKTKQ